MSRILPEPLLYHKKGEGVVSNQKSESEQEQRDNKKSDKVETPGVNGSINVCNGKTQRRHPAHPQKAIDRLQVSLHILIK